ncbi:nucleotide exchange factor GrpE [Paludicola sp. MB14-C6]|uniref:nucleotide exchange factor GrpE n=1 Tax=Paludihabitans sp. MB14-C6 TaxID=3070656 RepID=UPI0027DB8A94|nr:nucleotide exchange factor GrpE [Paludicola sp. MB14-C6]WMJ22480.1 nucleotide exchange factor GrpE [Paludicola sp. MB14-C6]
MAKAKQQNPEEVVEEVQAEETVEKQEPTNESVELEKLQEENKELNEKLLRQFAEFDNYKKRTQKEKEELSIYAKAMCLKGILSVVDNFERALDSECQDAEFKKGMEMIFTQMQEALKAQGLEEIEALNQEFNPEFHNAINQVEDENFGENTVCNVFQKGYKIGDRVIRHAMVVVANP